MRKSDPMIIAISGTPGAGKTSVAKILKSLLGAHLVSLNVLLKNKKIKSVLDRKRHSRIVDIKDVRGVVQKEVQKDKINIVEGHLSHLLDADIIIVLRCRPDILKKRMHKKKWNKNKIKENTDSEILDAITIEALEHHPKNKIIEVDTTKKSPRSTALLIKKVLSNYRLQKKYCVGKIDWSEKFADYLIEEK